MTPSQLAWGALCVVTTIMVALAGCVAFVGWDLTQESDVVPQIPFSSADWKLATPIEDYRTVRSQMVDDLLERNDLADMARADLFTLLGPPDVSRTDEPEIAPILFDGWDMGYRLGLERIGWASMKTEYLVFRFTSDGSVAELGLTCI